jgi:hypothetical protein
VATIQALPAAVKRWEDVTRRTQHKPTTEIETMKYFLLEGQHLVPFSELGDLVPKHHAFLKKGYEDGHFLFSGPQIPRMAAF